MKEKLSRFLNAVERALRVVIPIAGDSRRELARKLTFLISFILFISAGYYLLDELLFQPQETTGEMEELRQWYQQPETEEETSPFFEEEEDTTVYPEGIADSFRVLYRRNSDVRAWIKFQAGANDLFGGTIDNPVVQTTNNDFYLNYSFLKKRDKAGTLYFDYRNDANTLRNNRNLIIYGHNLNSGLMFSRFNLLASGNVSRAKQLSTVTLDSLYGEQLTYKVFAVMIINVKSEEGPVFNYLRTEFTDESFQTFVNQIRMRSMYDFGDVDVQAGDQLLTMSTCSNKRDTHLKDARTVVVARLVREGEDLRVDSSKTVKNEDVLMPYGWYTAQGLTPPEYYTK